MTISLPIQHHWYGKEWRRQLDVCLHVLRRKKGPTAKSLGEGGSKNWRWHIIVWYDKTFNDKIHYGHPQCGFHMGHDKLSLMIFKHCQWRFATVKHHKLSLLSSAMTFSTSGCIQCITSITRKQTILSLDMLHGVLTAKGMGWKRSSRKDFVWRRQSCNCNKVSKYQTANTGFLQLCTS